MTQRAWIDAMRSLVYTNAAALDRADAAADPDEAREWRELADLLIPLSKSLCTDVVNETTSLAVQIHGGMGYVEETGIAQHYRDARIAAIYEGTNGIQAADLVGRKLAMRGGGVIADLLDEFELRVKELADIDGLGGFATRLDEAIATAGCDHSLDRDRTVGRSLAARSVRPVPATARHDGVCRPAREGRRGCVERSGRGLRRRLPGRTSHQRQVLRGADPPDDRRVARRRHRSRRRPLRTDRRPTALIA